MAQHEIEKHCKHIETTGKNYEKFFVSLKTKHYKKTGEVIEKIETLLELV